MSKIRDNFSHAATTLHIVDMSKSLSFYRDQLGFEVSFTWKEPIEYAVLRRGEISIHLSLGTREEVIETKRTSLYFFVYDIEAAYKELKTNGAAVSDAIVAEDYGMKEFFLRDPDGYLITIGQGSSG